MAKKPDLTVTYRAVAELVPYAHNPRQHSDAQVGEIVRSIETFGWTNPILTDGSSGVIAGHGRLLAAQRLGLKTVPVIELTGLSEKKKRALILADNKITENARWDLDILRSEIEGLDDALRGVIGFDGDELDELFGGGAGAPEVYEVDASPVADSFWITVSGPLEDQARVLQRIRTLLAEMTSVSIEMGTTDDLFSG